MKLIKLSFLAIGMFLTTLLQSAQGDEKNALIPERLLISFLKNTPQELHEKKANLNPKKDGQAIAAIDLLLKKLQRAKGGTAQGKKDAEWFVENKATKWIADFLTDVYFRADGVQLLARIGDARVVPMILDTLETTVGPDAQVYGYESGDERSAKLFFKKEAVKTVEALLGKNLVDEEKIFLVYNSYMTSPMDKLSDKMAAAVTSPENFEKLNAGIRQFIVDARREWKAQSALK